MSKKKKIVQNGRKRNMENAQEFILTRLKHIEGWQKSDIKVILITRYDLPVSYNGHGM